MRVYVSGPMKHGDMASNLRNAIACGAQLIQAGHEPLIPHLNFYLSIMFPLEYEELMRVDLEWIKVAQAIIRLPGNSDGSDREVALARHFGIPVYFGLTHFMEVTQAVKL